MTPSRRPSRGPLAHLGDVVDVPDHLSQLQPAWLAVVIASVDLDHPRKGGRTDARRLAAKILTLELDTFYDHKGRRGMLPAQSEPKPKRGEN